MTKIIFESRLVRWCRIPKKENAYPCQTARGLHKGENRNKQSGKNTASSECISCIPGSSKCVFVLPFHPEKKTTKRHFFYISGRSKYIYIYIYYAIEDHYISTFTMYDVYRKIPVTCDTWIWRFQISVKRTDSLLETKPLHLKPCGFPR